MIQMQTNLDVADNSGVPVRGASLSRASASSTRRRFTSYRFHSAGVILHSVKS